MKRGKNKNHIMAVWFYGADKSSGGGRSVGANRGIAGNISSK